jgi:hypothetical protein
MKENAQMRRSLLGLLVGCMALFALATPTPAKAAVWCGWYWNWYGRCYVAYTVVRPVVVRPVAVAVVRPVAVAVVRPVYRVAYRPVVVPYYYTAVAYRPAYVAYARPTYAYAYAPGIRRVWYRY